MFQSLYYFSTNRRPKRTFYDILGIDKNSDYDEIKQAYKKIVRKNHPDQTAGDKEKEELANLRLQEINEAYKILYNKETRNKYDEYIFGSAINMKKDNKNNQNDEIQSKKYELNESHFEEWNERINQTASFTSVQDAHNWFGIAGRKARLEDEKLARLNFDDKKKMRHLKFKKPPQGSNGFIWSLVLFCGMTALTTMWLTRPKWKNHDK